jgi:hypothetical protein
MKSVIGLGCSWTQGEGGYTEETWKQYNGWVRLETEKGKHLIPEEQEASWVNQLCKNYLTDYTPINLGQRGIGNRGAVRMLYLTDLDTVSEATIVLMLSGFDRFDYFAENWRHEHYKFKTLWPQLRHREEFIVYSKLLHNEPAVAVETACCIIEAQTFARAHGFKFVFANAFDHRSRDYFDIYCPEVANRINWDNYFHNSVDYKSFAELLIKKDGKTSFKEAMSFYSKLSWPSEYITNCIHPTAKGYKLIAEELAKFL